MDVVSKMAKRRRDSTRISLNAWKQCDPSEFSVISDDLLALAASLTPANTEIDRQLTMEVLAARGCGGLAIARRLEIAGGESGLSWTWVALAAIAGRGYHLSVPGHGDRDLAVLILAARLFRHAENVQIREEHYALRSWGKQAVHEAAGNPSSESSMIRERAQAWLKIVRVHGLEGKMPVNGGLDAARFILVGTTASKHLTALSRTLAQISGQPVSAKALTANTGGVSEAVVLATDGQPGLVVCASIPASEKSGDDRNFAGAWKVLTQRLPLAGGPAPDVLETVLKAEFPWLENAIDAIVGDLRIRRQMGVGWAKWRPTLLVGPSGTGKTRLARRIAELIGAGFGEVNAAGSSDNRALQGTARGWGTAHPSQVLAVIRHSKCANPVMLVDEVDKSSSNGRNGDIKQTLLTMLEPLTARAWPDECIQAPCNLSQVNWLLAANDTLPLRGPLLTRLRVIKCCLPRAEHFGALMWGIRRDLAAEFGVRVCDLPTFPPEIEAALSTAFVQGISVRRVKAAVEGAIRVTVADPAYRPLLN